MYLIHFLSEEWKCSISITGSLRFWFPRIWNCFSSTELDVGVHLCLLFSKISKHLLLFYWYWARGCAPFCKISDFLLIAILVMVEIQPRMVMTSTDQTKFPPCLGMTSCFPDGLTVCISKLARKGGKYVLMANKWDRGERTSNLHESFFPNGNVYMLTGFLLGMYVASLGHTTYQSTVGALY